MSYNNLNFFIDDLQIIVWPDVDAKKSYKGMNETELENAILVVNNEINNADNLQINYDLLY